MAGRQPYSLAGCPPSRRPPAEKLSVESRRLGVEAAPRGRPGRPERWWRGLRSPASIQSWAIAERSPTRLPWAAVAAATRGRGARRTGSRRSAWRTIHSASAPDRSGQEPRRRATRVRTTNASTCAWVPSKTAQSVRRKPREERAPDQPDGRPRSERVVRGRQRREAVDVGASPSRRRRSATPQGRCAAPSAARPSARRASDDGGMHGGRGHRPVGPDRQRPLGVADTLAVEGEVHHELERSRAVERLRRRRAPRPDRAPRPRHRRGVTPGNGRRRGRAAWGRRDSNPHWGRFKRPASASWATPPADPFLTPTGTPMRMSRWLTTSARWT